MVPPPARLVLRNTEMTLGAPTVRPVVITTSCLPSPSRSPVATPRGTFPTPLVAGEAKAILPEVEILRKMASTAAVCGSPGRAGNSKIRFAIPIDVGDGTFKVHVASSDVGLISKGKLLPPALVFRRRERPVPALPETAPDEPPIPVEIACGE